MADAGVKRKLDEVDGKEKKQEEPKSSKAESAPINSKPAGIEKNILRVYYDRLFPVAPFFRWLSYSDSTELISRREFSFTLEGDVYVRYCAFKTKVRATPPPFTLGARGGLVSLLLHKEARSPASPRPTPRPPSAANALFH